MKQLNSIQSTIEEIDADIKALEAEKKDLKTALRILTDHGFNLGAGLYTKDEVYDVMVGRKIAAIKSYRDRTDASLKESKRAIDKLSISIDNADRTSGRKEVPF